MKIRFTDGVEREVVGFLVEDPDRAAVVVVNLPPSHPVKVILSDAFDITQCPLQGGPENYPVP